MQTHRYLSLFPCQLRSLLIITGLLLVLAGCDAPPPEGVDQAAPEDTQQPQN